jgi:hypothetical protein
MPKDKVICNWCMTISYVDFDADYCVECKQIGYLMDIEQEVIV